MLIIGLFLILILTTAASYVMNRRKVRMGYVWMMLGLSALLTWFILLFLPYQDVGPLMLQDWFQTGSSQMNLIFSINPKNWAMVFALLSLHVFFMFTSATLPELDRDFRFWIIEAIEIILTLALLLSANLLSVILTWTILDISTLLYRIFVREDWEREEIFYPFVFKLAGSFLLIFTNAKLVGSGQSTLLENLPVSSSTSLLFSAILHSGIFPYRPIRQNKKLIVTIIDYFTFLLPFISSLFLVAYLPTPDLHFIARIILGLIFLIMVYFFGSRWLKSSKTLAAVQNALFSFIGFLGFLFSINNRSSITHWFIIYTLSLSYLLLYYRRSKNLRFFSILLILSMTGLPFSLIDYSTIELSSLTSYMLLLGLVVFHVIWNIGFLRLLFMQKEDFEELDTSHQMIYMGGLGLALLSLGVITFRSLGSLLDELTNWWIGILIVLLTIGINVWLTRKEKKEEVSVIEDEKKPEQSRQVIDFLYFRWFFNAADILVQILHRIVSTFTQILEGEGGMLWSIVLLALLFTLLKIR